MGFVFYALGQWWQKRYYRKHGEYPKGMGAKEGLVFFFVMLGVIFAVFGILMVVVH